MTATISFSELKRGLDNEEIKLDDISQYFKEVPNLEAPFSPRFIVDESKVDISGVAPEELAPGPIVDWLNRRARARRNRKYKEKISAGFGGLKLVSEGDSWFQYPWKKNDDLIDFLLRDEELAIYCESAAGDELADMLNPNNRRRIVKAINENRSDGFLFSGGGNDIAGKEFKNYIQNACPSENAEDYIQQSFYRFLDGAMEAYRVFWDEILSESDEYPELKLYSAHVKIFIHGYDYAIPRENGKWLGPTLRNKRIPKTYWNDIVRIMIAAYNQRLSQLADAAPNSRLIHVSLIGAIGNEDQWRDELHGKPEACERAARRFKRSINAAYS